MSEIASNKRIAKNTLMLYFRMLLSMCIAFYTSRVILATLGVEDYGIYNVVGGVAAMFTFLNSSLAGATSRFLTYDLGRGETEKLKATFSASFTIHVILSLIIFVLCETVGLWMLENKLVIPENRMFAARILFQLSTISAMLTITQTPFSAVIIAHEHMKAYAYISIIEVTLKLIIVYFLTIIPYDKLIIYGVLYFAVSVLILLINRVYAMRCFSECSMKISRDRALIMPMLKFSGWDLYGNMSIMLRSHGVNILQNMFFGPAVNAAAGLAAQVLGGMTGFSGNFIMAANPQIIKLYAAGHIAEMQALTEKASRLAFFLLFFVSFPCFLELPFVLELWLKDVPDYTAVFVRLSIIFHLSRIMFFPLSAIIHGTGKVVRISFINGTVYMLVLPITYALYKLFDCSPTIPYILNAVLGVFGCFLNLQTVKMYVPEFRARQYLIHAPLRALLAVAIGAIIPIILLDIMPYGWGGFFVVCSSCVVTNSISMLYIGLNAHERQSVVDAVLRKLHIKTKK
jgi:O-antigen/teichoic acid export membrane protein